MSWLVLVLVLAAFWVPSFLADWAGPVLPELVPLVLTVSLHFMAGILAIYLAISRLHDLDLSGWLALFMLIPALNVLFFFYLAFASGNEEENRFGDEPEPPSLTVTALGVYAPILTCLFAAVGIYLGQDSLLEMVREWPVTASSSLDLENPQ